MSLVELWSVFWRDEVMIASGSAHERAPMTTKSRNMAAILQLIGRPRHAALVCSVHL